jgi:hypothetical protein
VHLTPRYRHAGHYLGAAVVVGERRYDHLNGNGARLVRAATRARCRVDVVRTWPAPSWHDALLLEASFKQRSDLPSPGTRNPGGRRGAAHSLAIYCPWCDPRATHHRPIPGQWLAKPPVQPTKEAS